MMAETTPPNAVQLLPFDGFSIARRKCPVKRFKKNIFLQETAPKRELFPRASVQLAV